MTILIAALICSAGLSQTGADTGLYAALLNDRYHAVPAARMVVQDTAVAMPVLQSSSSEWLKNFDDVPIELRRLASRPSPTRVHRLDVSLFPSLTRFISTSTIDRIFAGGGPHDNWSAFATEVKAQGWMAFSDALLAGDQLNALVYYEANCGGLCGEGGYAWLRRDTVGSPWRVAKKIVSWMA